jgi:hypothetical protein
VSTGDRHNTLNSPSINRTAVRVIKGEEYREAFQPSMSDPSSTSRCGERLHISLKMQLVIACTGLALYDLYLLVVGLS